MDERLLHEGIGSHMPLEATPHWSWRNPLNLLAGAPVAALVAALIGILL